MKLRVLAISIGTALLCLSVTAIAGNAAQTQKYKMKPHIRSIGKNGIQGRLLPPATTCSNRRVVKLKQVIKNRTNVLLDTTTSSGTGFFELSAPGKLKKGVVYKVVGPKQPGYQKGTRCTKNTKKISF